MFCTKIHAEENDKPIKKSMGYKIFVTEFSLVFHVPKSDRYDLYEKYEVPSKSNTLTRHYKVDYKRCRVNRIEKSQ